MAALEQGARKGTPLHFRRGDEDARMLAREGKNRRGGERTLLVYSFHAYPLAAKPLIAPGLSVMLNYAQ